MIESIIEELFATIRFLLYIIIIYWSPARLFRVYILGHDPDDRESSFGLKFLWILMDLASWAFLLGLILWIFF